MQCVLLHAVDIEKKYATVVTAVVPCGMTVVSLKKQTDFPL